MPLWPTPLKLESEVPLRNVSMLPTAVLNLWETTNNLADTLLIDTGSSNTWVGYKTLEIHVSRTDELISGGR